MTTLPEKTGNIRTMCEESGDEQQRRAEEWAKRFVAEMQFREDNPSLAAFQVRIEGIICIAFFRMRKE